MDPTAPPRPLLPFSVLVKLGMGGARGSTRTEPLHCLPTGLSRGRTDPLAPSLGRQPLPPARTTCPTCCPCRHAPQHRPGGSWQPPPRQTASVKPQGCFLKGQAQVQADLHRIPMSWPRSASFSGKRKPALWLVNRPEPDAGKTLIWEGSRTPRLQAASGLLPFPRVHWSQAGRGAGCPCCTPCPEGVLKGLAAWPVARSLTHSPPPALGTSDLWASPALSRQGLSPAGVRASLPQGPGAGARASSSSPS